MKTLFFALAFLVASVAVVVAETFPSRPITVVVPFPAGGPTDALGRVVADRMKRALNQSVIIENVTGAAGTIGAAHVAHSAPDGYTTILGHWQTHVVNGATFSLSFDLVNDFAPCQNEAYNPGMPSSSIVGVSGVAAHRVLAITT